MLNDAVSSIPTNEGSAADESTIEATELLEWEAKVGRGECRFR